MARNISFTLKYWKQDGPNAEGHFDTREMKNIPDDTSFLEMLDILNEELIEEGKEPFVFDHDCREGICGMCSLYINGTPHGKTESGATTCQLYMRRFNDGDTITVEPWMPTPYLFRRRRPMRLWTVRHVSVVEHAWQHARTDLPCSS